MNVFWTQLGRLFIQATLTVVAGILVYLYVRYLSHDIILREDVAKAKQDIHDLKGNVNLLARATNTNIVSYHKEADDYRSQLHIRNDEESDVDKPPA
jgi:hypothetical protein